MRERERESMKVFIANIWECSTDVLLLQRCYNHMPKQKLVDIKRNKKQEGTMEEILCI